MIKLYVKNPRKMLNTDYTARRRNFPAKIASIDPIPIEINPKLCEKIEHLQL